MKKVLLAAAAALLLCVAAYAGEEARLLRFPATNGTEITFTYAGDLWSVPATGGIARRLTSHIVLANGFAAVLPPSGCYCGVK